MLRVKIVTNEGKEVSLLANNVMVYEDMVVVKCKLSTIYFEYYENVEVEVENIGE